MQRFTRSLPKTCIATTQWRLEFIYPGVAQLVAHLIGVKGRFKRAWKAFWAKPLCYTGVYCEDKEKMKKFLINCLELINEED